MKTLKKNSWRRSVHYLSLKNVINSLQRFLEIEKTSGKEVWNQDNLKLYQKLLLNGLLKALKSTSTLRRFKLKKTNRILEHRLQISWKQDTCKHIMQLPKQLLIFMFVCKRTTSGMTGNKCKWAGICAPYTSHISRKYSLTLRQTPVILMTLQILKIFSMI